MSKCLCSGLPYGGCGQSFRGVRSFEAHRVGRFGVDRRCLAADELSAAQWTYTQGLWAHPGNAPVTFHVPENTAVRAMIDQLSPSAALAG